MMCHTLCRWCLPKQKTLSNVGPGRNSQNNYCRKTKHILHRKRDRPNMYSSREVKSRSAKAKRQRTRKSGVSLMSAHCRWQQFKSAGGWTHSELALHLMDIHEKFCGTGCSAKHSTSKIKSIVDAERYFLNV